MYGIEKDVEADKSETSLSDLLVNIFLTPITAENSRRSWTIYWINENMNSFPPFTKNKDVS